MKGISVLTTIVLALVVIGAINWGLVGFFNWNLVTAILGGETAADASAFSRIIYAIVGLAGIATLFLLPRLSETRAPARKRAETHV